MLNALVGAFNQEKALVGAFFLWLYNFKIRQHSFPATTIQLIYGGEQAKKPDTSAACPRLAWLSTDKYHLAEENFFNTIKVSSFSIVYLRLFNVKTFRWFCK